VFSVDKLTKYPITKDYDKAIKCYGGNGPIFGKNNIKICDNSNYNSDSYVKPGRHYSIPEAANG
jgi:hypothetical protein